MSGGVRSLNAGITSLAKSRIDRFTSSWGRPPKLNVVLKMSNSKLSIDRWIAAMHCSGLP